MKHLSNIPPHIYSVLEVNLSAIEQNYKILRHNFKGEKIAAVVKDNAYGLGLAGIVPTLYKAGCRDFFVSTIGGALEIKSLVKDSTVYVLNGAYEGAEDILYTHDFIPVLISYSQIQKWALKAQSVGKPLKAVIHFDTGMSRTGLGRDETERLLKDLSVLNNIEVLYWMSHLACSDKPQHSLNEEQRSRFNEIIAQLPKAKKSFVNSDGVFLGSQYHCDLARAGISLYGFNALGNRLQPAVSIYAKILQIRNVDYGTSIGYEATYKFEKPARVATLPVGYAQGWSTTLSNQGYVAIKGVKAPIVGRVSMDLMGIDITHLPFDEVLENQWIELLGPTISPQELAKAGRIIPYEIILTLRNHYQVYREN